MAAGLPDLVDCSQLAAAAAVVERVYELGELQRLGDLLADPRGTVSARFAFAKLASGRPGAKVAVDAAPILICQRCMQDFALHVNGGSELEFTANAAVDAAESARELVEMKSGLVSLRELAEEELLLALPIAPACSTPMTCGKAPGYATAMAPAGAADDMRRPFGALKDLLKKT
jgi:uncharacterized metal-binding protein YceD (DUF177 family)